MADRRPEKFWSRWTMTLGVVAVLGIAAALERKPKKLSSGRPY